MDGECTDGFLCKKFNKVNIILAFQFSQFLIESCVNYNEHQSIYLILLFRGKSRLNGVIN